MPPAVAVLSSREGGHILSGRSRFARGTDCPISAIPSTTRSSSLPTAAGSVWGRRRLTSAQFAGQAVGIKEVHDDIWLVSFKDYDLGYFDLDTRVLEPLDNPFGPRLLPM